MLISFTYFAAETEDFRRYGVPCALDSVLGGPNTGFGELALAINSPKCWDNQNRISVILGGRRWSPPQLDLHISFPHRMWILRLDHQFNRPSSTSSKVNIFNFQSHPVYSLLRIYLSTNYISTWLDVSVSMGGRCCCCCIFSLCAIGWRSWDRRQRWKGSWQRRSEASPKDSSWQHPRHNQASHPSSRPPWRCQAYLSE